MKEKAILQAVKSLQKSKFGNGVTAIKVELEANFRRGQGGCDDSHTCYECDGDWEDYSECYQCSGLGYFRQQVEGRWAACDYDAYVEAEHTEGWQGAECDECYGRGQQPCGTCEEGYVECDGDCDGDEWGSELVCHDFLMEKLVGLGLAEHRDEQTNRGSYFWPINALRYAKFYRDGSVDSEFTFTIMLDNPENIFLLPKIIKIWNELGEEIGNEVDVRGAGMHMALLNTRDGSYGRSTSYSDTQLRKFYNFRRSMSLLLPALYCLGASGEDSRGLGYRQPTIDRNTHRAAIDLRHGALEFRIFDTCYENPDQILDNVVVISKCMRYWNSRYIPSGMEKVTERTSFGDSGGDKLERFYHRIEHVDLLNQGLRKLKPSYLSITEIKKQRNLKVSKPAINRRVKEFTKGLKVEYTEYTDRFDWSLTVRRHRLVADYMESRGRGTTAEQVAEQVEEAITKRKAERQTLQKYVEQRLRENNSRGNEFTLCAE